MTTQPAPAVLRERLRSAAPIVAPGVYDGVSARIAADLGFTSVYVSGAGTAAGRGLPDMGLMDLGTLVDATRVIATSSRASPIVDLDTGYGSALSIRRAMRELAEAGAAAVHIEDQGFPRRCGYLTNDECVPVSEMLERLRAAQEAGTDLVLIARTDALLTTGLDDAIERAQEYQEGGAELVFVNGIRDLDELRRVRDSIDAPLLYNVSGSDRSPRISRADAAGLGVAIVIYPIHAARAAARAARELLTAIAEDLPISDQLLEPFEPFMELAGWNDALAFEERLGTPGRAT